MRRGGTINGMLVTLSILGALTVLTVYMAPQYLTARTAEPQGIPAAQPAHQALIDDLAAIMSQAVGVLAVHRRGVTPYEEVVLWLADSDAEGSDGRADVSELAILSHSSVLHTITIYRLADERASASWAGRTTPEFCDQWRAHAGVERLVLGRGVSDMRLETIGGGEDQWGESGRWGALQRLRLTLTWAADSADGADEASVLVDTVLFPSGVGP